MFAEDIILKPVLTEKGYDGIASKKYTFYVKKDANKTQIKQAVEKPKQRPAGNSGPVRPADIDWSARNDEELSFEDKLSRFKKDADEKMLALKRSNESKRSGGYHRGGSTY